jgi:hypothetical protein
MEQFKREIQAGEVACQQMRDARRGYASRVFVNYGIWRQVRVVAEANTASHTNCVA